MTKPGHYIPRPTADGSQTLYSASYQQTYHSHHGALTESYHVFINGSGVAQRLAHHQPTQILEVGFGTGLNFLATVAQANKTPLHYVALEKNWLSAEVLATLNYHQLLPTVQDVVDAFLAWRRTLPDTINNTVVDYTFRQNKRLTIVLGEATSVVIPPLNYQAIYHDAFSPDSNPELWTTDFFSRLYKCLAVGETLATYSVKGTVRRTLQAVGFTVEKRPGPPNGKREMLVAWKGKPP